MVVARRAMVPGVSDIGFYRNCIEELSSKGLHRLGARAFGRLPRPLDISSGTPIIGAAR
jgi:hypothetical protein